jgi:hypothetical protein
VALVDLKNVAETIRDRFTGKHNHRGHSMSSPPHLQVRP